MKVYTTCTVCGGMGVIFDARKNDDVPCPAGCDNGTQVTEVPDPPKDGKK
jgi:hypothetical protein